MSHVEEPAPAAVPDETGSPAASAAVPVRPPRLRAGVLVGVVAGLSLLAVLGSALYLTRPTPAWTVEVSLLVRPAATQPDAFTAGYYENLSRGQVVQTYAEVLRSRKLGGVDGKGRAAAEVVVVPETFLIRVVLTSQTRSTAAARGLQVGNEAVAVIAALQQPYTVGLVGSPADSVQQSGGLDPALVGAAAICGVLYGLAAQQLVLFLQRRRYVRFLEAARADDLTTPA